MNRHALYFITGSSGSGKTTLLSGVVKSIHPNLAAYHFDDLGVPSPEEMKVKWGGPDQWQEMNARLWIEKVAKLEKPGLVVLEGQVRPTTMLDAARKAGLTTIHITLVDCSHAERQRRLVENRLQPELDKLDMYAWAAYLRGQADALKLEIIDTTSLSLDEGIQMLANSIRRFAEETGLPLSNLDGG